MKLIRILACTFLTVNLLSGQKSTVDSFKIEHLNWYNKDYPSDKIIGASVDKAYDSLLLNLKYKDTIVVAVIDGGVDIYHEDLLGKIWVNQDEIPDNNVDDDGNGYIDDIHGWNFIGNKLGENIYYESYEFTRILRDTTNPNYNKARKLYDEEVIKRQKDSAMINKFESVYKMALSVIYEHTGVDVNCKEDLDRVYSFDQSVSNAKKFLSLKYSQGFSEKDMEAFKQRNSDFFTYFLNVDFNPRTLIGDNPEDFEDKYYGNNDVVGPRSDHGTSVAGIIAANRNNGKGINGIASCVKIMPVRVVPYGDERDKDVALGIIYAVDNGARIINLSFGKQISPQKEFVDYAVKYAESHNVLIFHGAGNDGNNIDEKEYFPNDNYLDGTRATNLITVGATSRLLTKDLPARFSNYGKQNVDIFAPGVDIVALDSSSTYNLVDGTSIATPVLTGTAAVILSCFPELTPQQTIELLLEGSFKVIKPTKVYKPDLISKKAPKAKFIDLSKSGGIVNLYKSLSLAIEKYKL